MEEMIVKLTKENKHLKEVIDIYKEGTEAIHDEFAKALDENNKLKERLKNIIQDTKEFLEVCDRNADGYYKHYETRQIATRFEGGVYRTQKD